VRVSKDVAGWAWGRSNANGAHRLIPTSAVGEADHRPASPAGRPRRLHAVTQTLFQAHSPCVRLAFETPFSTFTCLFSISRDNYSVTV
jgi:hypothetical protein